MSEQLDSTTDPDVNRGYVINIVIWAGFGISTAFVAARVFTRFCLTKTQGWDDYWLIFSVVLGLIANVGTSLSIAQGFGRHLVYLSTDQVTKILYYSAIFQAFGIALISFPKLAVMILIIRMMGPHKQGRRLLYFIITVQFTTCLVSIILIYAQCDPPSHFWHPAEPAKCISPLILQRFSIFTAAWSAFTDLTLAVFPITILWNLKIELRKKVQISVLMSMGIFAMVAAIIKTTTLPNEQSPDPTWALYSLNIWASIEANIIIICASLPVLPHLIRRIKSRIFRPSSSSSRPDEITLESDKDTNRLHHESNDPYKSRARSESSQPKSLDSRLPETTHNELV